MNTENKKPNNPFAFPCEKDEPEKGMTLRDYFANSAMQGSLSSGIIKEGIPNDILAKHFYELADAMLKQREL